MYESYVAKYGKEGKTTITSGVTLAIALWEAKQPMEAERLLTRLATVSKRVLGPQHNTTKQVKSWLKNCLWELKRTKVISYLRGLMIACLAFSTAKFIRTLGVEYHTWAR
jgi:hypothetical protein